MLFNADVWNKIVFKINPGFSIQVYIRVSKRSIRQIQYTSKRHIFSTEKTLSWKSLEKLISAQNFVTNSLKHIDIDTYHDTYQCDHISAQKVNIKGVEIEKNCLVSTDTLDILLGFLHQFFTIYFFTAKKGNVKMI